MKEFITKYQKAIVGMGAIVVLVLCYFQQKELTKLRAEQNGEVKVNTYDSLNSEIFILHTQNQRYELSLEWLNEVNPKAGKQFQEFMERVTE